MKTVFLVILLLNFCQPQAATLQLSGVVAPAPVLWQQSQKLTIVPQPEFQVFVAPVGEANSPKWRIVKVPTTVNSSLHVKVVSL